MFLNGSNSVWIKNKKDEIVPISLKDLERHKNYKEIFVYNGKEWDTVKTIDKIEKASNVEIVLKNGTTLNILKEDYEKNKITLDTYIPYRIVPIFKEKEIPYISDLIPWFLGYYVANGSYSEDIIQISSNQKKDFVLQNIQTLCDQYNEVCKIYNEKGSLSREFHISSKIFSAFIAEYISGYTCYHKHFSKKCFNTNRNFIESLLQGYLDGDGHYEGKNYRYNGSFTRKNYELAKDLRNISNLLGISIKMKKAHTKFDDRVFPTWNFKFTKPISKDNYKVKEIKENSTKINLYNLQLNNSNTICLCSGEVI